MIPPPILTWELRRATDKPLFRGLRLIAAIFAAMTAFVVMNSLWNNGIVTHSGRQPFFALLGISWIYSFGQAALFSTILGLGAFCLATLRIAHYRNESNISRPPRSVRKRRSIDSSRDFVKAWLQGRCAKPARSILLPTAFGLAAVVTWNAVTPATDANLMTASIAAILLQGFVVRILTIGNAAENLNYTRKSGELELALATPLKSSRVRRQMLNVLDREFYLQLGWLIVLNLIHLIYAQAVIQAPQFIYLIWLVALADTILVAMDGKTSIRCALLQSALRKPTKEIIWRLSVTIAVVPWLLLVGAVAALNALTMVFLLPIDYLINSGSQWFADLLRDVFGGPISLSPRTQPLFYFAPYFGPLFIVVVRWATGAFWNAHLYFRSKRTLNHDFRRLVAEGRVPRYNLTDRSTRRRRKSRTHLLNPARSRC